MNTKILRKLSSRVRLVQDGKYYVVETRSSSKDNWTPSPGLSSLSKAIRMKHNFTQRLIRDMGYFIFFKERRIQKVNRVRRKMSKRGELILK